MKKLVWIFLVMLSASEMRAQTVLSEGRVLYDVFLNAVSLKPEGTLIVTLKGGLMKRELKMQNGYSNTIIYNSKLNKTISYSQLQGNKVSKVLNATELKASNAKFENALCLGGSENKTIAGYKANRMDVTYTDGVKNTVYYTAEVKPQIKEYNAMFNKIDGLPLQYEVVSGANKIVMVAKSVKAEPINNSEFDELVGYQVVE